jgi:Tfp pilus assembly protein FimV
MAWALYRFNPRAFIGGDINMLRSGVYLRVPTPETVSRWSHTQALALIKANPGPTSTAGVSTPDPQIRSRSSAVIASPVTDDRAALSNSPKEEPPGVVPDTVAKAESELPQSLFRLLPPASIGSTRSDGYVGAPVSARNQERVNQLLAQENRHIQESREEIARAREQLDDTARQISALVDTMEQKDSEIKGLETRLADLREFVRQQSIAVATPESPWLNRLVLEALLLAAMVGVLAVTLSRWSTAGRRHEGNAYEGTIALELPAPVSNPNQSPPEVAEHEIDTPLPEEECRVEPAVGDEPVNDHTEYEEIELRGDPLMEANAYLAYGYHDKAKEVLVDFIKEEPAHAEGRLLMLRVLHTIREKRTFRRHAEALLELVDDRLDERWMEVARLGRALLPEERLFDADVHQRADDENWEETVWTGTRPDLTDCDDHIYLDIDEFKYVDLFLLDGAEEAGNDSAPEPSIDVAAESEGTEADPAEWRVKIMGGSEDTTVRFEPDGPGDDTSDDGQY